MVIVNNYRVTIVTKPLLRGHERTLEKVPRVSRKRPWRFTVTGSISLFLSAADNSNFERWNLITNGQFEDWKCWCSEVLRPDNVACGPALAKAVTSWDSPLNFFTRKDGVKYSTEILTSSECLRTHISSSWSKLTLSSARLPSLLDSSRLPCDWSVLSLVYLTWRMLVLMSFFLLQSLYKVCFRALSHRQI